MNRFSELCTGRYFVIPENQRGFSWEPGHAEDIFEDLILAGTHAHYMGPVIVTRTGTPDFQDDDLNTTAEFTLEDGQQRLTTFFIIASEIQKRLEIINGAPDIESTDLERLLFYNNGGRQLRLKNKNTELHQYLSYILTGAPAPPADRTPPMEALDRVRQWIVAFLSMKQLPDLIIWKKKLTNQAKFIWVDLASESVNRYLTFDAINSRGLPLSEFDKIKNFCILVTTVRGLAVQPEREWYKAITQLEAFGVSSRAEEAAFITDLYAAFYNERVGQGDVHASFVRKYRDLLKVADVTLESELRDFVELWDSMAHSFGFVTTPSRRQYYGALCTQTAGKWLDRLDNMALPTITRILLTASHRKLTAPQFETLVRGCEIYTFRVYAIMRYRKDKNGGAITEMAHEVLRQAKDEGYVLERICGWLQSLAPMPDVIKQLADGEVKYYYDWRMRGWSHCYYFLYEYELWNSPQGVGPLAWETSGDGRINTQEHILPQQHRDNGWWEAHWPDEAEADHFKHRLGNLVLTSNNQALARKSIDRKIQDTAAAHYYNHPNATNSEKRIPQFTSGVEWRPGNILKREFEMLEFAAKRWSIPCCADNGTIALPKEFSDQGPAVAKIVLNEQVCFGIAYGTGDVVAADEDDNDQPPTI